jgi:hypothetical protein
MKKIYLSVIAVAVAATSTSIAQTVSQQQVTTAVAKHVLIPSADAAAIDATDTLGLEEFGESLYQYGSPTGYVFGTNDLYDASFNAHQYNYEYGAGFLVNMEYNVIGAMMWFGGKDNVSGAPGDLKVKMYNIADNKALAGATSQAPDAPGPNQLLATADLAFDDVDTASFNIPTFAFFDTPEWVNEDFVLAVDIKNLYVAPAADTVWLWADENGDSDGEMTWTKVGFDINPATLWAVTSGLLQGGLDVNLAIFAIVSESGVGIEEQGYMNGVKMTTFPNPALSSDNVTIQYGLETAAKNVDLNIYTLSGQVAYTSAQGAKASGVHNLNVPAGTLSAGSYIYSIEADGRRMAKKMEILK